MSLQGTTSSPRGREIPSRRVVLNNLEQLPGDYSTTPGGTLFSTTPGGTRLIYDRSFLLECRNSPLTKSPPIMAKIPGITAPGEIEVAKENGRKIPEEKEKSDHPEEQPQFEMDI
ncbi:eukaryotic translation initiation factor 4E-binding protein 1-like [Haliotis cracherodii]|uniref:eukaryotic translation initiation factor 4E-binding protein 1-like n=1 Tax=Haliotis rufescens TaxID=6454 RepID=UPI001EB004D1|nr:eukaryotic translation initiation factor 4E-binding protein 1-like [Haliotis rufescens]